MLILFHPDSKVVGAELSDLGASMAVENSKEEYFFV